MNTANWIPDLFMKRILEDKNWTLFSPNETPELHHIYGKKFEEKYEEYEEKARNGLIIFLVIIVVIIGGGLVFFFYIKNKKSYKFDKIDSGDSSKIVMWMLDTDYDGRSIYPQQIFFPQSGSSGGWSKLAKTLKSEINEQFIEHFTGTTSLPFSAGKNKQIAVKIVDDRGIESLRIIKIE